MELYQFFGSDLQLTQAADLKLVGGEEATVQRLYRRLLTPIKGYLWEPEFGAGLPQYVGQNLTTALSREIKGVIKTNMFNEATVARSPEPDITLIQDGNNLACTIVYVSKPSGQPFTLSFTISPTGA
jgi:phage baseplate assembly protein W